MVRVVITVVNLFFPIDIYGSVGPQCTSHCCPVIRAQILTFVVAHLLAYPS